MKNKELDFILQFHEKQKEFEIDKSLFEDYKKKFYLEIEEYFKKEGIDKFLEFSYTDRFDEETKIKVNKVQKSNVVFNADKIEKRLDKNVSKSIIVKKYEINNIEGLIKYLKECNVDPKVFKSFLTITKSVDVKELERLEELGKVSLSQLNGCYSIKTQKPYFTVREKRRKDDGAKEW